jgi:hypothetical protein
VLVARIDRYGLQVTDAVELQAAQDAADRGPAQTGVARDPVAGPALTPQAGDDIDLRLRRRAAQSAGARTAIAQTGCAAFTIPPDPLGRRLRRHTLFHNSARQQLSTSRRQSGILMTVHSFPFR